MEQTQWIGSYTQIWAVGGVQATPALTFVVAQANTSGTVTTTNIGQTSDGHLEGVSSLSINNGAVSTYSATLLDYTASLYYDSNTVATLFDERTLISQTVTPIDISTSATLNAGASAWHDYDLQTDHYAIAYFLNGGYYENPLYWGTTCDAVSGDCSIDGGGGFAYWITAAAIYIGSSVADQGYVPPDGSLPPFDLNAYNSFLAGSPAYPTFYASVTEWIKRVTEAYVAAKLLGDQLNPNDATNIPPIPLYVDVEDDYYDIGSAERRRVFIVKDIYGHPWNKDYSLRIRERFTNIFNFGMTPPPLPNGVWSRGLPNSRNEAPIYDDATYLDHIQGAVLDPTAQSKYLHYYYATDFVLPSFMQGISSVFTAPGLIGGGPAMPLWIKDTLNKCSPTTTLPAAGEELNGQYVYVDGDNGPGTGCRVQ